MKCVFFLFLFFSFCMRCVLDDMGIAKLPLVIHLTEPARRNSESSGRHTVCFFRFIKKVVNICFVVKEIAIFSMTNLKIDDDF